MPDADKVSQPEPAQAREVELVLLSQRRAEQRLRRLATVALELGGAQTLADLMDVVIHRGVPVLGADGGAVLMTEADGFRLALSDRLGDDVQVIYGFVPLDNPLPAPHVARTGETVVLPTRAAGIAFTPAMAQVYEDTGRSAWAFAPLRLGDRLLGALAVAWIDEHDVDEDELGLIAAFATQCAQALGRIQAGEASQAATALVQRMLESVQRSLLTQPPTPDTVEIAVRYLPAVAEAHVGGDWYDAFTTRSGSLLVSVGDVAGHDGDAAAAMAQLRNLMRGLAIDSSDDPDDLLTRLDYAIDNLDLRVIATAIVARVTPGLPGGDGGVRVEWSSAGHLPPLVRLADGQVHVFAVEEGDLPLGVEASTDRTQHTTVLPPGAVLVLCTDGLVERRGEHLDVGIGRLADALTETSESAPEEICDALLSAMLHEAPEDDIALLVLRLSPHQSDGDAGTS